MISEPPLHRVTEEFNVLPHRIDPLTDFYSLVSIPSLDGRNSTKHIFVLNEQTKRRVKREGKENFFLILDDKKKIKWLVKEKLISQPFLCQKKYAVQLKRCNLLT